MKRQITFLLLLTCTSLFAQVDCSYNDLISKPNMVVNGDFEAGNTGFNSPLTYYTSSPLDEGEYVITNNAASVHFGYSGTDHTSGSGKFMVINGSSVVTDVWCQTVNIEQNTYYRFASWFNNIVNHVSYPGTPIAYVELRINGQKISKNISLPDLPDQWILLDTLWFSGSNTTATLCIRATSTSANGNDFSVDDVSFKKCACSIVHSSGPDTTICPNDSAQLYASGGTSYLWAPTTGLSNPNIANPKAKPTSNTQYIVTITKGICTTRDTVNITIHNFSINAGNDVTITQGQSTQLNATGGTSYSWTPTTGLSNPNIANPIASPATTTTYIVTATNGGCSMKDTVVVTVLPQVNCSYNDLINTPNIVTNGDFEAGNTGFSSALPYYSSGGLMPEGQYTILNNATSVNGAWSGTDHTSGSGKFFVANGGNSVMDVWCQTVNVEPNTYYRFAAWFNNIINPAIYSGPFPKMELRINGQTISKNITIPETPEEWILLDTLWFSGGNTTAQLCIRNATVGGAGNDFGIDDISFKKCSASQTTCFSCATPDPLNAGLITCYPFSGNANDESGNGNHGTNNGATFTTDRFNAANKAAMFNGSSSYITISNSASLQSPTTEFTASLWVYITAWYIDAGNWASAFCKSNSASATQYRISMMPNGASFIFNGKMVNVPISSGTIQLNQWYHIAIAANNNIVTFYINGILQSSTTFSGTFSNDNTMPLEIGRDYAGNSVDYFNGKIDDLRLYNRALSASEVLQLYNLPQSSGGIITANAGTDQTICPKDSAQLTATGGTTYSWLPTAGLNNPNIANPKASPDTTTQYIVAVSNSSCVGYDTVVVFVDTLNPIIDTVVLMCVGDSVQLQAHGGVSYKWLANAAISDTTSASPFVKPTVSSWFYVAVTTNHSCVFEDSVFVEIISSLSTISGADTTICERDSAQLSATGGTTFIWFPTIGLSNANIANPKASPATTTTYIVKGEVGNCFAYDTVTIFVKPAPTALFTIDPTTGNIPFDVTTTNLSSPLPLTYLWKNMADTGFSSTDFEPVITINQMGEHYILLEVTDAEGCTDRTRSGVIDATDDIRIFIPNVFTPNSDKINDFFEVLFSKTTIKKVSGTIWNRWGGKVYEFEMPNGKWWNGKTEDGNDCTEGVYVYIIETFDFKNKRIKTYRGTVTLLR